MASLKLYHDTRSIRKDGTSPIKIAVNHKSRFLINLKIYVSPDNFINNEIIIPKNPARQKNLNTYIQHQLVYVENTINKLTLLGKLSEMSDLQLKKTLDNNGVLQDDKPILFRDHYLKFIDKKTKDGTKRVYLHTLNRIGQFCELDTLIFSDITVKWLDALNVEFSRTCGINARGIHMRNIRAVINDAIRDDVIDQNNYPFRKWKIKKEATPKRSLNIEQLRMLRDYECEPFMQQYRDVFMLIFYLIGINAIDLFNLTEIKDGRIEFRRAKTGRLYSVKVEPEALSIIEKYRGDKYLLNVLDRYQDYLNYLHKLNNNLKIIGPVTIVSRKNGKLGKKEYHPIFPKLSTYWARHSWATIAASLDIPKETIAAALGHGGNTVTDIYIDFDQTKIDKANRKVLNYLKSNKLHI